MIPLIHTLSLGRMLRMAHRFVACRRRALFGAVAAMAVWDTPAASAQTIERSPSIFHELSRHRIQTQTMRIEGTITRTQSNGNSHRYGGRIQIVVGELSIECRVLTIDLQPHSGMNDTSASIAATGPFGNGMIWRFSANHVLARYRNQTVTADRGFFQLRSGLASLDGNVVVSDDVEVARGEQLFIDLERDTTRLIKKKMRIAN
jgi:lipopolysaccharide export system protein LptA